MSEHTNGTPPNPAILLVYLLPPLKRVGQGILLFNCTKFHQYPSSLGGVALTRHIDRQMNRLVLINNFSYIKLQITINKTIDIWYFKFHKIS